MDQLLLLLPLALLALILLSGRRRQRAAAQTQRELAPGVEVVTTAGLFARVVEVEDTAVVLELAPGVTSRWSRAAVARVVPDPAPVDADEVADGTSPRPPGGEADTAGAPGPTDETRR